MEKEIKKPVKILFVCLGNICRSPAAEGVFKHMLRQRGITDRFNIDSAGTYGGHAGELPSHAFTRCPARIFAGTSQSPCKTRRFRKIRFDFGYGRLQHRYAPFHGRLSRRSRKSKAGDRLLPALPGRLYPRPLLRWSRRLRECIEYLGRCL